VSNVEPQMHVKVTINDLYKEQQETNKLLVKTVAHLEQLADIPDRMRSVELKQARNEWIEKIAYAALTGAILSIISVVVNAVAKV
jgi:hypothetical protein